MQWQVRHGSGIQVNTVKTFIEIKRWYLHRPDRIVGLFDGVYDQPLGRVRQYQLIHDLNLVIGQSDARQCFSHSRR
jgi:hypothetical protein